MAPESPAVDLSRPLLPQVAALGGAYDAWVHRPIRPRGSLRIFESDALEAMSHVPWWVVPGVWVPIVGFLAWAGVSLGGVPAARLLLLAPAGLLLWTLTEYLLHRFVFHFKPRGPVGRRIHFLGHGVHHLDPWDPTRLVFPPLAGILVATPIFGVLLFAALPTDRPVGNALGLMAGLLAGYMAYDLIHYATHHAKPRTRWGKYLKAYHLAHHHKHPDRMFGVSQPLWDLVFGTGRPRT